MAKSLMRRIENNLSTGYDYKVVKEGVESWLVYWLENNCSSPDEFDIITALIDDIDAPILTRTA